MSVLKAHECQKRPNLQTNELNTTFFLFDEPLKGSKSLKIFKIKLMFRFNKLSHLSKSVHIGENSEILTVSNKKKIFDRYCQVDNYLIDKWTKPNLH
jgi:hypothetical protein